MYRVPITARGVEHTEVLLIRRSPGRILPGLWQCVSGALEPGERVVAGALRELLEETGFGPDDIEAFYDLDGPPVRITTPHIPLPAADILEDIALPTADRIVERVHRSMQ
jgi:8-oxo-dGTP pyrophosphatase MutT (NUDIX family)